VNLDKTLVSFLEEDAFEKDVTTALIPASECEAEVVANEECILAGVNEVSRLFELQGIKMVFLKNDGEVCGEGETVMRLKGSNKSMLSVERTALNLLGRMSGVATLCKKAVGVTGRYGVKVALTRKTMPGLRDFDKKAAKIAGAWPHRHDLGDMVLIKDNHLVFCKSIEEVVGKAKESYPNLKVEAEADSLEQALAAAEAGADIVMLDNFPISEASKAIEKLRAYPVKIELSGGINFDNLEVYARLKPDIISMGHLTKSARIVDFSLNVIG